MTPAQLRASLAVTLSVAMDAGMLEARRLAIVEQRLSRLLERIEDNPWEYAGIMPD
jgi:hypothetical protein